MKHKELAQLRRFLFVIVSVKEPRKVFLEFEDLQATAGHKEEGE